MARVVDDALGLWSFQKKICRRRCELQGDTVFISQSPKSVEFVSHLMSIGAFGRNQVAHMPKRGACDVRAQLVVTWISLFGRQRNIAVYGSGVSGAFDHVNSKRLLRKLRARGIPEETLLVPGSWLSERIAGVAVGNKLSRDMKINNMED